MSDSDAPNLCPGWDPTWPQSLKMWMLEASCEAMTYGALNYDSYHRRAIDQQPGRRTFPVSIHALDTYIDVSYPTPSSVSQLTLHLSSQSTRPPQLHRSNRSHLRHDVHAPRLDRPPHPHPRPLHPSIPIHLRPVDSARLNKRTSTDDYCE